MIEISEQSKKELFMQQLDIQDQLKDFNSFSDAEINLIDDSMAHFVYVLLNGSEEEILNLIAYTRMKYKKIFKAWS